MAHIGRVVVVDLNPANERTILAMKIYNSWKDLVLAIIAGQEDKFVCVAQNIVDSGGLLAQALDRKVILELAPEDQRMEVELPPLVVPHMDNAFWDGKQMHGKMGGMYFGESKPGFCDVPPVLDFLGDEPNAPDLTAIKERLDFPFLFPNFGGKRFQNTFWEIGGGKTHGDSVVGGALHDLRFGREGDILPDDIIGHEVPHGLPPLVLGHDTFGKAGYDIYLFDGPEPADIYKPTDFIYTTERSLQDVLWEHAKPGDTIVCANHALIRLGEHLAGVWGKTGITFKLVDDPKQRIPEPETYADIRKD